MKRRAKTIVGTAVIIIIAVVLLLSVRNMRLYIVLSGSMEPVLPVGSLVIADCSDTQVQSGDIAVFSKEGQTVTHRIIDITDNGYVTKGDANKDYDAGIVAQQEILGTVILCIPYLGYGLMWLQEYRILVIGVILLLIFLILLFPKSEKKKDPKKEKKGELKL